MANDPAIVLKGIRKKFGAKKVLDGIDLQVPRAQVCGLLGPSGSGKTTMVKIIAGIELADSGEVYVFGQKMPRLEMMKSIGYMTQSDALYTELTAKENLDFFASLYGLSGQRKKQRMESVMELVNLANDMKKPIHQYSGGMRRRLSLAIALLHEPQLLILDEPTVGIDPVLRQTIWEELHRLVANGISLLVTTHVMDEAEKCHQIGMLRETKLIAFGTPAQLKEETGAATIESAFLHYGGVQA